MAITKNIGGKFYITMKVVDQNGGELRSVSVGTAAKHEIEIENISLTTRHVKAVGRLPNGTRALEFVVQGHTSDHWAEQRLSLPPTGKCALGADIRRSNGIARVKEPVQCDDIAEWRGTLAPQSVTSNPFQIMIDAM